MRWLFLAFLAATPTLAQDQPPSVEGQIDPTRFDDGNRAIMVRIPQDPDPGEATSVTLVKSRAYVRRGDAGPILVEVIDRDGTISDSWRAQRPDAGGGETVRLAEGRYAIPYTKTIERVTITDTDSGLATDVRLEPAIASFCLSQPDDIACDRVDLSAMVSPVDGAPQTLAVGETTTMTVEADFRNAIGETAGVSMLVNPFFVSPNLTVETGDEVRADEARVDGAFRKMLRVTYKITCDAAGAGRIFPEGVIVPTGGPSVIDIDPGNNRWNTILDVLCTS